MMEKTMQRRAKIGLYSDRMVLSVEEAGTSGSFCLYRREIEEDFFDADGRPQKEVLIAAAQKLKKSAAELKSEDIVCLGYGLLRYDDGSLMEHLKKNLEVPVVAVSGAEQARAAKTAMLVQTKGKVRFEVGIHSSDLSTQIFSCRQDESWQESFPLGWRMLWQQCRKLIPDRLEEEQMRQEIKKVLGMTSQLRRQEADRIQAAGFDAAARMVMMLSGLSDRGPEGVCLEREVFVHIFRTLRNPSLRWLKMLEQAGGGFPQKVFCQLLILETVMNFLGAKEVSICRVFLEDHLYGAAAPICGC